MLAAVIVKLESAPAAPEALATADVPAVAVAATRLASEASMPRASETRLIAAAMSETVEPAPKENASKPSFPPISKTTSAVTMLLW